ncbi:MAG: transposase, partial [Rickettsia endosymbiont of Ixodes persulcatus]|nr:transposase [Rickettsia endosymbiont of Ixodes persulcatus]
YLKGKSSRKIQQEFPELRKQYWGKHLWAVGYFVMAFYVFIKCYPRNFCLQRRFFIRGF